MKNVKNVIKERLKGGKDWTADHKELVVLVGLSTSALTTYIMYKSFENKSYNDFGDLDS